MANRVAQLAQRLNSRLPHRVLVLHNEDNLLRSALQTTALSDQLPVSDRGFWLRELTTQVNLCRRSPSRFRVEADMPTRLFHEPMHLAKAQAGPLASSLGSEEGIERPLQHAARHALA